MCPKVIKRDIKCHAYDPKLAAEGPLWTRFLSEGEFMCSFHLRFQKLIIHFLLEFFDEAISYNYYTAQGRTGNTQGNPVMKAGIH